MKKMFLFFVLAMLLCNYDVLLGQPANIIHGQVTDAGGNPVEFANVALLGLPDSLMTTGTVTGREGDFSIPADTGRQYVLEISCLGYHRESLNLHVDSGNMDAGTISLTPKSYVLSEFRAEQTRIRAARKSGATTYYVNNSMQKASATGVDLVKFVPGIQVDLRQNVSVDGDKNIMVLVDGMERSVHYLGQVDSKLIDKMEINRQPGSEYPSDVGAVINVVTRKSSSAGVSGHLYGEVPVSQKEVYSYPTARFQYSTGKVSIFGSYRGEFSYFDIEAENTKEVTREAATVDFINRRMVHQKNWSHKAMTGLDWQVNEQNRLNLYAFVNPYSNEHDGQVRAIHEKADGSRFERLFDQNDTDANLATGGSLFFKHLYDQDGRELFLESAYYQSRARKKTNYYAQAEEKELEDRSEPFEKEMVGRVKYQTSVGGKFLAKVGVEARIRQIGDDLLSNSEYREKIWATHGSIERGFNRLEMKGGLRAEYSRTDSEDFKDREEWSLFPFVSLQYTVKEGRHLNLSYRRSVARPAIHQLNPSITFPDIFTTQKGNPALRPELKSEAELEYSFLSESNYLAGGFFYSVSSDVLGLLTRVEDNGTFTKQYNNLGDVRQAGCFLKAALSINSGISFNPYFKGFWQQATPNKLFKKNNISTRSQWTAEWGGTLAVQLNKGFSLSASAMQRPDVHKIQSTVFEDLLYFVSIDKSLFENLHIGITSAVPFREEVTYQGHEIRGANYSEMAEANILTSTFPLWFKIKYSFTTGKVKKQIQPSDEFSDKRERKGF